MQRAKANEANTINEAIVVGIVLKMGVFTKSKGHTMCNTTMINSINPPMIISNLANLFGFICGFFIWVNRLMIDFFLLDQTADDHVQCVGQHDEGHS